jgi:glycosyltransferase involved in cell wall biosynthesis
LNVLYVCADRGIPLRGHKGASVHVRSITSALQRGGHDVTIAARRVDGDDHEPAVSRLVRLDEDVCDQQARLKALIESFGIELVIERYCLQSGPAEETSRDCGVRLMLEVNAPLADEAARYRTLDDPDAADREHQTLRAADRIQVVSSALLRYVKSVAPDVPSRWIPNGVDARIFQEAAPASLPAAGSGPVVGFVGSMKAWHDVGVLLDAFAAVRGDLSAAHLLLVGSGPEERALRQRAAMADLAGSVTFTGHVSHEEVPGLVKLFDVAVAPYLPQADFYFHPLKVVEYLAAGVPVIYSDQGDLADLIGPAGLPYRPGSADELAASLLTVLTDADLLSRLADKSIGRTAGYDWDTIASRVLAFAVEDAVEP